MSMSSPDTSSPVARKRSDSAVSSSSSEGYEDVEELDLGNDDDKPIALKRSEGKESVAKVRVTKPPAGKGQDRIEEMDDEGEGEGSGDDSDSDYSSVEGGVESVTDKLDEVLDGLIDNVDEEEDAELLPLSDVEISDSEDSNFEFDVEEPVKPLKPVPQVSAPADNTNEMLGLRFGVCEDK
ncbi:unnamed protein product, partial [Symbiodinium sp. KB8]